MHLFIEINLEVIIRGVLNSHIGRNNKNYTWVSGGFAYGVRDEGGEKISNFVSSYDLVEANTQK